MRRAAQVLLPFVLITTTAAPQDQASLSTSSGAALIDKHIRERWDAEGIKPVAASEDVEFLRRVWLDIAGVIPPADVTLGFITDRRSDKRVAMVDELLGSPQYAQNWSSIWEATLLGYEPRNPTGQNTLAAWLRDEAFAKNMRYDEMTRQIVAAAGSNIKNGAAIYYTSQMQRGMQVSDIAARTSRVFLGVQIHCAQCHDHPFDRYTQEDYTSVLAFFVRVQQRKVNPQDQRDQEFEVFENKRGEAQFPPTPEAKNRRAMPPKSLDGLGPEDGESRRDAFARIITRPESAQFARAVVNRYWGHFLGRGLVHPVDDFNLRNKASHPELINELAQDFIAHRYDLKWLIRAICTSQVYQLTSRHPAKGAPAEKHFGFALVRAMTPEQLFNSMTEAVGVEDRYRAQERRAEGREQVMNEKRNYLRQFRFLFGDDEQVDIVDFDGTIPQALAMLNGDILNRRMREPNSRLDLILRTRTNVAERLELLVLSALSRRPTTAERLRYANYLQEHGNKREAYEDILWALMNSSEFMFIH